jgi:hypothetical protein
LRREKEYEHRFDYGENHGNVATFPGKVSRCYCLDHHNVSIRHFVRAKLVVSVDAAATAHNILRHELLYRLGFLGDVLALLYILYTLLLYSLFRPVSRSLSLLAAVFSLVGCAVQAVLLLFLLAPLHVLKDAPPFSAFTA